MSPSLRKLASLGQCSDSSSYARIFYRSGIWFCLYEKHIGSGCLIQMGKYLKKDLTFKMCLFIIALALSGKRSAIGYRIGFASLAQLAEHLTLNQGVQGSNP